MENLSCNMISNEHRTLVTMIAIVLSLFSLIVTTTFCDAPQANAATSEINVAHSKKDREYIKNYVAKKMLSQIKKKNATEISTVKNGIALNSKDARKIVSTIKMTKEKMRYVHNVNTIYASENIQASNNSDKGITKIKITRRYSQKEFDKTKKTARKVAKNANKKKNTTSKIRYINSWMCKNIKYDWNGYRNHKANYSSHNSAYAALVKKRSMCSGFAEAFDMICWFTGINCRIVGGTANGSAGWGAHNWNTVKVNGKWKNIDVTWNSCVSQNRWLLKTNKQFKKDHNKKYTVIMKHPDMLVF